ncbi:hypothetical protein H6G84_03745 [Synechococcus elongatus PCC 7942 = FACHB-805]|uniref:hypothetical protein n=1 Tax=Synechococcus elongatus TaxID=32046 RepID=UPI000585B59B|nr:hypothetical protein [Synechococcus elongatus]AJD58883.1 hypothetical protein M744_07210 [Synechococcus elongatus UTEX 2973]MBD2706622.1 hypothetical protein [Synechococcus elongatus PCC 7942 = FACHB-805]
MPHVFSEFLMVLNGELEGYKSSRNQALNWANIKATSGLYRGLTFWPKSKESWGTGKNFIFYRETIFQISTGLEVDGKILHRSSQSLSL